MTNSKYQRIERLRGIAGLVFGFGAGQGALFLAQSWLVLRDELAFVGQVGLGLAGLSLAQLVADCGGVFILSRHAAQGRGDGFFASANVVRALFGISAALVLALIAYFAGGATERAVILGGVAAIVIWSLNLVGMLDGLGRSAISGPLSSIAWLLAALGLLAYDPARPEASGLLVGGLFSLGALITICAQYVIAYRAGRRVLTARPSMREMKSFAKEGSFYLLANIPAQIYGRSLIVIANVFLGAEVAGAVVYARNLVTAATQGITFVRRVEFPALAQRLANAALPIRQVLGLQWWSIGASLAFVAVVVAVVTLGPELGGSGEESVRTALLCLSIPVPIWTLSSSFLQAFLALGNTRIYAIVANTTIWIGAGLILLTVRQMGLQSFLLGEFLIYGSQLCSYLFYYRYAFLRLRDWAVSHPVA